MADIIEENEFPVEITLAEKWWHLFENKCHVGCVLYEPPQIKASYCWEGSVNQIM